MRLTIWETTEYQRAYMDFLSDLVELIAAELKFSGVVYDMSLLKNEPIVFLAAYSEYKRCRISAQKRQVELSKDLLDSPQWTTHQEAIQNLADLARNGLDLTPYQSKRVKSFSKRDLLLSDWGIQHLHLGKHLPVRVSQSAVVHFYTQSS